MRTRPKGQAGRPWVDETVPRAGALLLQHPDRYVRRIDHSIRREWGFLPVFTPCDHRSGKAINVRSAGARWRTPSALKGSTPALGEHYQPGTRSPARRDWHVDRSTPLPWLQRNYALITRTQGPLTGRIRRHRGHLSLCPHRSGGVCHWTGILSEFAELEFAPTCAARRAKSAFADRA